MARRRKRSRIYALRGRYYADFRDYSAVGGKREALVPEGDRYATRDYDEATRLVTERLKELEDMRRGMAPFRQRKNPTLAEYTQRHLEVKSQYRRRSTCVRDELSLSHIAEYFGPDMRLRQIGVDKLSDYLKWRGQQPGKKGNTVSAQTLRHELNALSNLYRRAMVEGAADINPVAVLTTT